MGIAWLVKFEVHRCFIQQRTGAGPDVLLFALAKIWSVSHARGMIPPTKSTVFLLRARRLETKQIANRARHASRDPNGMRNRERSLLVRRLITCFISEIYDPTRSESTSISSCFPKDCCLQQTACFPLRYDRWRLH